MEILILDILYDRTLTDSEKLAKIYEMVKHEDKNYRE